MKTPSGKKRDRLQGLLRCRKTWQFPSSSTPGKIRTVSLWESGELTCNCPAWTFKKSGVDRTCQHVRSVEAERRFSQDLGWRPDLSSASATSLGYDLRRSVVPVSPKPKKVAPLVVGEDAPLRHIRFLDD